MKFIQTLKNGWNYTTSSFSSLLSRAGRIFSKNSQGRVARPASTAARRNPVAQKPVAVSAKKSSKGFFEAIKGLFFSAPKEAPKPRKRSINHQIFLRNGGRII